VQEPIHLPPPAPPPPAGSSVPGPRTLESGPIRARES
jgi:hypothetical protein